MKKNDRRRLTLIKDTVVNLAEATASSRFMIEDLRGVVDRAVCDALKTFAQLDLVAIDLQRRLEDVAAKIAAGDPPVSAPSGDRVLEQAAPKYDPRWIAALTDHSPLKASLYVVLEYQVGVDWFQWACVPSGAGSVHQLQRTLRSAAPPAVWGPWTVIGVDADDYYAWHDVMVSGKNHRIISSGHDEWPGHRKTTEALAVVPIHVLDYAAETIERLRKQIDVTAAAQQSGPLVPAPPPPPPPAIARAPVVDADADARLQVLDAVQALKIPSKCGCVLEFKVAGAWYQVDWSTSGQISSCRVLDLGGTTAPAHWNAWVPIADDVVGALIDKGQHHRLISGPAAAGIPWKRVESEMLVLVPHDLLRILVLQQTTTPRPA